MVLGNQVHQFLTLKHKTHQQNTSEHPIRNMGNKDSKSSGSMSDWTKMGTEDGKEIWKNNKSSELAEMRAVTIDPQYDLNDELKIYHMREHNRDSLVRAFATESIDKKKSSGGMCSNTKKINVLTENMPYRLSDLPQLTFPESMLFLRESLRGYSKVYKSYGPIHVTPQLIGVNQFGEPKCWVNENWAMNHPTHELPTLQTTKLKDVSKEEYLAYGAKYRDETEMVHNITAVIEEKCQEGRFPQAFAQQVELNSTTFKKLELYIEDFINYNQIFIPPKINYDTVFVSKYQARLEEQHRMNQRGSQAVHQQQGGQQQGGQAGFSQQVRTTTYQGNNANQQIGYNQENQAGGVTTVARTTTYEGGNRAYNSGYGNSATGNAQWNTVQSQYRPNLEAQSSANNNVTASVTNNYSSSSYNAPSFGGYASGSGVGTKYQSTSYNTSGNQFGGNFTTPYTESGVGNYNTTTTTYEKYESKPTNYQSNTYQSSYGNENNAYKSSYGNESSNNYGYDFGSTQKTGNSNATGAKEMPFGDPKTYEEFEKIRDQSKLIDGLTGELIGAQVYSSHLPTTNLSNTGGAYSSSLSGGYSNTGGYSGMTGGYSNTGGYSGTTGTYTSNYGNEGSTGGMYSTKTVTKTESYSPINNFSSNTSGTGFSDFHTGMNTGRYEAIQADKAMGISHGVTSYANEPTYGTSNYGLESKHSSSLANDYSSGTSGYTGGGYSNTLTKYETSTGGNTYGASGTQGVSEGKYAEAFNNLLQPTTNTGGYTVTTTTTTERKYTTEEDNHNNYSTHIGDGNISQSHITSIKESVLKEGNHTTDNILEGIGKMVDRSSNDVIANSNVSKS